MNDSSPNPGKYPSLVKMHVRFPLSGFQRYGRQSRAIRGRRDNLGRLPLEVEKPSHWVIRIWLDLPIYSVQAPSFPLE